MGEKRDRTITTEAERMLPMYDRICRTRQNETMRVGDLIAQAMYEAESEETQEALLNLAIKVLKS